MRSFFTTLNRLNRVVHRTPKPTNIDEENINKSKNNAQDTRGSDLENNDDVLHPRKIHRGIKSQDNVPLRANDVI